MTFDANRNTIVSGVTSFVVSSLKIHPNEIDLVYRARLRCTDRFPKFDICIVKDRIGTMDTSFDRE